MAMEQPYVVASPAVESPAEETTAVGGQEEPTMSMARASVDRHYPLATRHGDTALYVPGTFMILAAVVRGSSDPLGVALCVLGGWLAGIGMLLPVLGVKVRGRGGRSVDYEVNGHSS
jgi:hypothetical protein